MSGYDNAAFASKTRDQPSDHCRLQHMDVNYIKPFTLDEAKEVPQDSRN
jgi:hypothetical protein